MLAESSEASSSKIRGGEGGWGSERTSAGRRGEEVESEGGEVSEGDEMEKDNPQLGAWQKGADTFGVGVREEGTGTVGAGVGEKEADGVGVGVGREGADGVGMGVDEEGDNIRVGVGQEERAPVGVRARQNKGEERQTERGDGVRRPDLEGASRESGRGGKGGSGTGGGRGRGGVVRAAPVGYRFRLGGGSTHSNGPSSSSHLSRSLRLPPRTLGSSVSKSSAVQDKHVSHREEGAVHQGSGGTLRRELAHEWRDVTRRGETEAREGRAVTHKGKRPTCREEAQEASTAEILRSEGKFSHHFLPARHSVTHRFLLLHEGNSLQIFIICRFAIVLLSPPAACGSSGVVKP